MCHVSLVMCHVSWVTCHLSPDTCHLSQNPKTENSVETQNKDKNLSKTGSQFCNMLYDQKSQAFLVLIADGGDRRQTDIPTYSLNWPRGRCSENNHFLNIGVEQYSLDPNCHFMKSGLCLFSPLIFTSNSLCPSVYINHALSIWLGPQFTQRYSNVEDRNLRTCNFFWQDHHYLSFQEPLSTPFKFHSS